MTTTVEATLPGLGAYKTHVSMKVTNMQLVSYTDKMWSGNMCLTNDATGIQNQQELQRGMFIHSFIECCVHCCGLQMFHVSASFLPLSLFGRIVWSQSSPSDHRPMFILVSLFLVCLLIFLLLLSAEYHDVLMCSSLCGPHKTTFLFFRVFSIDVSFTPIFCSTSMFVV